MTDLLNAFIAGGQAGRQARQARNAFADQRDLRALAPAVIGGDIDALAQAAAIDPATAGQYDDMNVNIAKRATGAAKYLMDAVTRGNPQEIEGRYQAVKPFLAKVGASQGKVPPERFDPAMVPLMEQLIARSQGMDGGDKAAHVSQRYVNTNGDVVVVMSDGTRMLTGDKADPRTQFVDVPGVGPQMVTMSGGQRGTVAPVLPAAPVAAPATAPNGANYAPTADDETAIIEREIGRPLTQGEHAQIAAGTFRLDVPLGGVAPSPVATNAPSAAWVRPDYAGQNAARADQAAQRADRAEARAGIPAGYQPDGRGGAVFIPGGPADPAVIARNNAAKPNAAATKEATARRAKIPQLQNAIRGMGRIETALAALDKLPLVDTGPLDQFAVKQLPEGKELSAAVGGIQNSFLALTRVPGIGSQSDLEARVAALQYPSLDNPPEVNARTMENLKLFARDLAQAYELAATEDAAAAPQGAAGGLRAGTVEDGYRFRGGDPADPANWEAL